MSECSAKQLRFPPVEGLTVRADFDGGALSSDFGVMLLRGIDQQIGLSEHLAQALDDRRHPSYIDHPLESLFAQRTYQIACGYADGNDANDLRRDTLFKLGLDREPLDPDSDLASASTFSRLENAATTQDLYRLAQAFVDQFIASYAKAPQLIVPETFENREQAQRAIFEYIEVFYNRQRRHSSIDYLAPLVYQHTHTCV